MNLISCLERASLFGAFALGVALFLQWILADRVPASWRVWVWRVALIQTALALIPLAPIALSVLPTRAPFVAPKSVEAPAPKIAPIVPASNAATAPESMAPKLEMAPPAIGETPQIQTAPVVPAPPQRAFDWRVSLVVIYLIGIAIQIAMLLRNALRVRQIVRACTPLDNAPLHALAARLNIKKEPRLIQSPNGAPFLVGILRPTIVLPRSLDSAHVEAVFAHELAHYKRKEIAVIAPNLV